MGEESANYKKFLLWLNIVQFANDCSQANVILTSKTVFAVTGILLCSITLSDFYFVFAEVLETMD